MRESVRRIKDESRARTGVAWSLRKGCGGGGDDAADGPDETDAPDERSSRAVSRVAAAGVARRRGLDRDRPDLPQADGTRARSETDFSPPFFLSRVIDNNHENDNRV